LLLEGGHPDVAGRDLQALGGERDPGPGRLALRGRDATADRVPQQRQRLRVAADAARLEHGAGTQPGSQIASTLNRLRPALRFSIAAYHCFATSPSLVRFRLPVASR